MEGGVGEGKDAAVGGDRVVVVAPRDGSEGGLDGSGGEAVGGLVVLVDGVMDCSARVAVSVVIASVLLVGCGSVVRDDAIVFNCFDDVGERACRINSDGSGFVELYPEVTATHGPVLSPDRRWVSIDLPGRGRGFVVLDSEGEEVTFIRDATVPWRWTGAVWAPDSESLLFGSAGDVIVVSIKDGAREVIEVSDSEIVTDLAVDPDGSRIAAILQPPPAGEDGVVLAGSRLVIVDRRTGAVEPVGAVSAPRDLDWSPDGSMLAVVEGGERERLVLVDPESGVMVGVVDSDSSGGSMHSPSWSPDGNLLAYVRTAAVAIHDLKSGTSTQITQDPIAVTIAAPSWSPDGERLVVAAYHTVDRELGLMTMRPDGQDPEHITQGVEGAGSRGQAWPMWS